MKLETAIEILQEELPRHAGLANPYIEDALKLGIEALKLIQAGRSKPGGMYFHDLPGETEE